MIHVIQTFLNDWRKILVTPEDLSRFPDVLSPRTSNTKLRITLLTTPEVLETGD